LKRRGRRGEGRKTLTDVFNTDKNRRKRGKERVSVRTTLPVTEGNRERGEGKKKKLPKKECSLPFREQGRERGGGKNGPQYSHYTYGGRD